MKLIVNGDDFGITRACNYAIIDCFQRGILRSTSLMTNMPGAEEAAVLMHKNPDLSVGLHLSLTAGRPLTKGLKTIVKADGTLDKGILKNTNQVDLHEIESEMRAQFDRFIELAGQLPTHINSHHGIELVPGAEKLQLALAAKYHLPVRRFFTLPEGNHPDCEFVLPKLCNIFKDDWSIPIVPEDILNFFTEDKVKSDEFYELAGHPGYVDYDLLQLSSLTTGRCYDAHNFSCKKLKDWVAQNTIELVTYEDIPLKAQQG